MSVSRFFLKDVETELDRLERLLQVYEREIREAFTDFLRDARDEAVIRRVADLLEARDVEEAIRAVDTFVNRFASVIPRIFSEAGAHEASQLAATLRPIIPTVAIAFDPSDPVGAMMMREATLEFIRQFGDQQREAVRQAMARAFNEGQGSTAAARAFRDAIGLTDHQEGIIRNYRRLLEEGSSEALDRALRDRRFDRTVRRAVDGGDPVKPEQIDKMVDRYRARMLAMRSENISRTEALRTSESAREAAFRQAMRQAGLDQSQVDQMWNAVGDHRTRHTHRAMNGQVKPLGVAFQSPSGALLRYPGDPMAPADEVINCRCHRTFRIKAEKARIAA